VKQIFYGQVSHGKAKDHDSEAEECPTHVQVEEQRHALLSAKARLEAVISQRFEAAATARERSTVLRFAKLYVP